MSLIKRNNPGNIRATSTSFREYAKLEDGIADMARLLQVYQDRHGLSTIRGIISRWAPPDDDNDTETYIQHMVEWGWGGRITPSTPLDMHSEDIIHLMRAMIRQEHGKQTDESIIRMALDSAGSKLSPATIEPGKRYEHADTLSHTSPKQREEEPKPTIEGFYHLETWKDNPAEVLKEKQNLRPRDKSVAEIQEQLHKLGYDLGPYKDKNGNKTGIDGRFGPKTKAALIAFQKAHELSPTGELDAATRDALNKAVPEADCSVEAKSAGNQLANSGVTSEPAQKVDTVLPNSQDYVKYGDSDLQYGTESTVGALREIAAQFKAKYGEEIAIGNISKDGGGDCPGHATHKKGVDVDIRPEATSGNGPTNWQAADYDREATKNLIELIQKKYPNAQILFNDPELLKDDNLVKHGLKRCDGHDNHLHVRFLG